MTWEQIRAAVLHRDGRCMNCGVVMGLAPHHIISKGAGGSDEMSNLITLCMVCHRAAQESYLVVGHRMSLAKGKRGRYLVLEADQVRFHLLGLAEQQNKRFDGVDNKGGKQDGS